MKTASAIKTFLIPWNVSTLALAFLQYAIDESAYLKKTWTETTILRTKLCQALRHAHDDWIPYGEDWLPWIWLDVGQASTAATFVEASISCGLPVRAGAIGYAHPSFVRIRVCTLDHQTLLLQSLRKFQLFL